MNNVLINLNSIELKYYHYIITLGKCNGICNTFTVISDKICVPNKYETSSLNVSKFFI